MKKLAFSILAMSVSMSAFATDIYFSKDRMERFSCQVARSIKTAYPDKSLHDFRKGILELLRTEINPWVDAYPIPAGFSTPNFINKLTHVSGFPMDRSEYYLQNAFILYGNPKMELKEPTENYFSSFIHLARSRHVAYLNGEEKRFKLRNETDLLEQIEDHLPTVANYTFPFLDSDGNPIMQQKEGVKEKNLYKLYIGNRNHKKFDEFVTESQKYNHFSSPLFMWLLKQENYSVSPEKLFEKAVDIYGDPIVALGVIPWIFSGDALTVDRGTSSVVSHKIEKLVEGDDIPGLQYHFWGYLTQGIIGNKHRVGALAFVYEKLYQKDLQDWTVDVLSLQTGSQVRKAFKNPEQCN
jgi:hypothetical protein